MTLAVIGGTGVYDPSLLSDVREETVATPYGPAQVTAGRLAAGGDVEVLFLARHGRGHSVPPHRINYRANIWALRELGADRVVATAAVGSLRPEIKPGEVVIVDQFLDFTKSRCSTFFDGEGKGVAHVDVSKPYCPGLRPALAGAAQAAGVTAHAGGTYVCTEGPRFETPAEIRMFARLGGDVVGMTGVPEVVLARELSLCYASVATVTNYAAGISTEPLTHREVLEVMAANAATMRAILRRTLAAVPRDRGCACGAPLEVFGI